jgi:hypothetical protein
MIVKRALGYTRGFGNVLHAGGIESSFVQDPQAGIDEEVSVVWLHDYNMTGHLDLVKTPFGGRSEYLSQRSSSELIPTFLRISLSFLPKMEETGTQRGLLLRARLATTKVLVGPSCELLVNPRKQWWAL